MAQADQVAYAARPETTGKVRSSKPMNGEEFLESLRDGREIYIYGERVKDVTTHPAFRNTARMIARLYDALHDPKHKDKLLVPTDTGNGGMTHAYFKCPKTVEESVAGRDAIAEWARICYGWLGRAPDYKAAFLGTLGANAEFYEPYQENARSWYRFSQERVPFVNHAIIHPPVDRNRPPQEVGDVYCHVEKETDAGIVVSGRQGGGDRLGADQLHLRRAPRPDPRGRQEVRGDLHDPDRRAGREADLPAVLRDDLVGDGQPVRLPARPRASTRTTRSSSWTRCWCPGRTCSATATSTRRTTSSRRPGFLPRALLHGCTRLAVKLDFIAGLLLKAVEATGSKDFRGVQANVGEVLVWRNLFWGLTEAMVRNPKPWIGDYLLPDIEPAGAYQITSTMAYTKVKYLIEQTVASGLIYLNSSARDFKNPAIRPYLDKYMRGSNGYNAVDRVKLLKLLWDAIGTEFGGRHELYEINYGGSTEEIRRYVLFGAQAMGTADKLKGFVEKCMAEYDLDGWKVPDLTNPGRAQPSRPATAGRRRRHQPTTCGFGRLAAVAAGGAKGGGGRNYPGGFRNPFADGG